MALTVTAARGPLLGAGAVLAIPTVPARTGGPKLGAGAEALDALKLDAKAFLKAEKATGKAGEIVAIPVHRDGVETVLLAGIGDGSEASLRKAAAAVSRRSRGARSLGTTLSVDRSASEVRAIAEAIGLVAYKFAYDSGVEGSGESSIKLRRVKLIVETPAEAKSALAAAAAVVSAVHLARDLANQPSLEKTPAWMADRAKALAGESGLKIKVRNEKQLAEQGFGGIIAVGKGSARPPRLVELTWSPEGADRHVVLIGKGITFDTGGLSLKPSDGMIAMKTDMAGGAAVLATMTALAALEIPVKVTGLIPLAENMPSGTAMRPSDVVTHYGGITDEVLNTDAEGRIVLADALAYAAAELKPDVMVDIATLTGAASLGLGKRHGALYATSDSLREELLRAASAGGERLWPMPLIEEYRDAIDSEIADLRNIGDPGKHYSGGSITAALFLREFTAKLPWAHLDIAGPGRADGDEDEIVKGATGFGVRTFIRWLEGMSTAA
jgi:leucyl aminopeptidase